MFTVRGFTVRPNPPNEIRENRPGLINLCEELRLFRTDRRRPFQGVVAEWVRALDWRPGGPGFEPSCGNIVIDIVGM